MSSKIAVLVLMVGGLFSGGSAWAQLAPANQAGVTMGHVQLNVRDIDATRKFFVDMGGTPAKIGAIEAVRFPGVILVLNKAVPTGAMEGSAVNHIGFVVKDGVALFTRMQKQGVKTASNGLDAQGKIYGGYVYTPDGVKVEIIARPALGVPMQFDQVHFFVADPGPSGGPAWSEIQTWYTTVLGANATRTQLSAPAANNLASAPMSQSLLAETNLRFSPAAASVPTKGRAMDHIGFEIKNLEAFTKQLTAKGVKLDIPYRKQGAIGTAFLTDPKGTYIELTEGLQ